ncbi:Lrp/AsnC ligand binding domain-containing protein [Salinirubellus salinus]|jgi:DNA-binding Lrp family transcriptional regulator|uniref:Lrp/AsnC ligand binding domain-containing protein n=1 Tax=Salinirubellus salinus TaxID=1364945 RepID=A0A9E7R023_9EURY|nr:Lrp/AsnC ligand binding domain-containing protein [Salinirubellus salinus]UWM52824.1 Lrp/AsnC ligand binding domain-containing protein [Salinirubellus salinus]
MARAFIMVKIDAGRAEETRQEITGFEGVTEAHVVAGEYDLIVEAETPEVYDLMRTVATQTRGLAGVIDTKTYVCLE